MRRADDEKLDGRRRGRTARGRGPGAGGPHDGVADVPAVCVPVLGRVAGRRLERPDAQTRAVHAVTVVRRIGQKRRAAAVRLLLLAADGSGRRGRDHTAGPDRRPDHVDDDRLQLRGRRHSGLYIRVTLCPT